MFCYFLFPQAYFAKNFEYWSQMLKTWHEMFRLCNAEYMHYKTNYILSVEVVLNSNYSTKN